MRRSIHSAATATLAVAALLTVAGCGEDAKEVVSPPITVTVDGLGPGDIVNGTISSTVSVNSGEGSPWESFIDDATDRCTGVPGGFQVDQLSIALNQAESRNVSAFQDVFSSSASVFFASTGAVDAIRVQIGSVAGISGTGPIDVTITGRRADLSALRQRMGSGDFHVGVRGPSDRPTDDDFELAVDVTFQARAFCLGSGDILEPEV